MEYVLKGSRIRVSELLEVEKAIIEENSKRFTLVYNSLVFSKDIIAKIGQFRETNQSQELIFHRKPIEDIDPHLTSFLQLLY